MIIYHAAHLPVKNKHILKNTILTVDICPSMCYDSHKILTLSLWELRERCVIWSLSRREFWGFPSIAVPKGHGIFYFGGKHMETRVAVMSIIVENGEMVETLNGILHQYGEYIIGRMGIPYRKRNVSIIAIALDAPQNTISALSGKIGSLKGVSVKTAYSGVISAGE